MQNMMKKVCANTGKLLSDTPKKSAQGYVVFKSVESVANALKLNNTTYQSHTIRVDHANPTVEPNRSVFVGNLPYDADEETLRDHFIKSLMDGEDLNESEGCAISGIRIVRDKETQKCKGFGYVTVRDATLVPLALQLHGSIYLKRDLRVMVCGKRFKSKRGNGGKGTGSSSSPTKNQSSKPKSEGAVSPAISRGGGGVKRRRARSEKKSVPHSGAGKTSKRAATEAKVNKRVKKLQNRAAKGMGKAKK
jgi:nucleolar protein 12